MKLKEIPKEGSKRRVNTLTDPSKKVYLTPGEFLWDNYKRGERLMREENKTKGVKSWKEINLNDKQLEMDLGPEDAKIRDESREKDRQLAMLKALEDNIEDQEVKFTKRQVKTILKNFNNTAKAIRNINRVLKEVL